MLVTDTPFVDLLAEPETAAALQQALLEHGLLCLRTVSRLAAATHNGRVHRRHGVV